MVQLFSSVIILGTYVSSCNRRVQIETVFQFRDVDRYFKTSRSLFVALLFLIRRGAENIIVWTPRHCSVCNNEYLDNRWTSSDSC